MTLKNATMTGADSLMRTLAESGVEACFANPGTTEMHLVHAVDSEPQMRSVLCLFEGVCTGAADGFGRMKGQPAVALLHLGCGLGNGISCLLNARRARTPLLTIVGNHASYHVPLDSPMTSDIGTLARPFSCWSKTDSDASTLAQDGADALTAALTPHPDPQGQIATLVVGVDAAWGEGGGAVLTDTCPTRPTVASETVDLAAQQLNADTFLLLDGPGITPAGLAAANRIAEVTNCQVRIPTFPARIDGGAGQPAVKKLPYFPEQMQHALRGARRIVLAGARAPASYFAYPHAPSNLVPEGCEVFSLARIEEDVLGALEAVADALDAPADAGRRNEANLPELPRGELTMASASAVIANRIPAGCIVAVDSGGGNDAFNPLQTAAPHTWLGLTAGAIGHGGPLAVGAAVACPDRQVLCLQGDGGGMYTNQSLWTQAREGLNITTVIYSNREYWILGFEFLRLGLPEMSDEGKALFNLSNPDIGWVELAGSMGVPGCRVEDAEQLDAALERSFAEPGPYLIEAAIPGPPHAALESLIPKKR